MYHTSLYNCFFKDYKKTEVNSVGKEGEGTLEDGGVSCGHSECQSQGVLPG